MLRKALVGVAAAVLVSATFVPSDAHTYRGGHARAYPGPRAGAVAGRGGMAYRAPAYRGTAYRGTAYRGPAYRGMAYRQGYYPNAGAAVGAAALGAAATVGAAAAATGAFGPGYYDNSYYSRGCVRNAYGYWECPQY